MEKIVVVDDEQQFRKRLIRAFQKRGYEVYGAADVDEAMAVIHEVRPAMAVVDLRMPGKSGLELVRSALAECPEIRIVILTGYGSIATATEAIRLGAAYYLPKPADVDDILAAFAKGGAEPAAESKDIETPSLARAEWEHINRVLTDCDGNISAAAKRLNVHRRTLQRKLHKYPPGQ
ncbi:MAG: response regulator [Thermodesulfobacteriota bacterium]